MKRRKPPLSVRCAAYRIRKQEKKKLSDAKKAEKLLARQEQIAKQSTLWCRPRPFMRNMPDISRERREALNKVMTEKMGTNPREPGKFYICEECGDRFLAEHCFIAHKRSHDGLVPYPCTYEGCKRGFKTMSDLKNHTIDHYANKKVSFKEDPYGNDEFKNRPPRNIDFTKIHELELLVQAQGDNCWGKKLNSAALVKDNTNKPKELQYPCEQINCDRYFSTKEELKVHTKSHKKVKEVKSSAESSDEATM